MLVLTRKKNESILITPDIEIEVVDIKRGRVRLGIVAPKHIAIHRKEMACVPAGHYEPTDIYIG